MIGAGGFADIGSFVELKICLLIALVYLIAAQIWHDQREVLAAPFLSLGDWCRKLSGETGEVRVGLLTIAKSATDKNRSVIRTVLQDSLDNRGQCTWRDDRSLVYFQRLGHRDALWFDPYDFLETAAGLISNVKPIAGTLENGWRALAMLQEGDLLSASPIESLDTSQLVGTFNALFADGIVVDLAAAHRAQVCAKLDDEAVAGAIPMAMRALQSGSPFAWCGLYRLYPIFRDQRLRLMFFLPKDVEPNAVTEWDDSL